MIEINLQKIERGIKTELRPVRRGGKVFQRKTRVGRKEKEIEYKSTHDYIQNETELTVDMRKGDKFTTDPLMGKQIIVYDKDKNRLDVWIKETSDMIQLSTIGAEKEGTGIGTKYLNGLKGYSDSTGKKLVIPNMTPQGQAYFKTRKWLVDDTVKLEYEEDGEKKSYWPEDTMSYTPEGIK